MKNDKIYQLKIRITTSQICLCQINLCKMGNEKGLNHRLLEINYTKRSSLTTFNNYYL